MEESTGWRSHLGEGGGYARKIPTSVYRFRYSFFALVFLLLIIRGRTMGKLVSIVTTCLVVLSSRLYFWKNWQKQRTPWRPSWARRTVAGSRFKTLRKSEIGYWKLTLWTLWRNGRTDRHRTLVEIWVSELCDDLQDGPSQARRPVTGCANPRQSRISGEFLRDVFGLFFP